MAERRKSRKKKDQEIKDDDPKPSKEEYAVAKFLRQKLPEKKTTLLGHKVEYFIASKAIDCLLDSPWATKKDKAEFLFNGRDTVVEFLDKMLQHKFFHRAKKIIVQKDGKKKKKEKDDEGNLTEDGKEKEQKKTKEKDKVKADDEKRGEEKKENEVVEKKKEKKKIKLDMHMEQVFIDGNEAYVWIYDPIPVRTWIIGTLMVVGAVLVCLFPLWPRTIRHYIYYLSVAAAGFLVFIIGLAVVRLVVFVAIWIVTFGKHHLWLLPNLTEDVGFFESFWPLYKYEYKGSKSKKTKEKKEGRKEKGEETKETENNEQDKDDSSTDQEGKEAEHVHTDSDGESEGDKNKTDNGDNGFEIVDAEEGMDQDNQEVRKEDGKTEAF